MNILFARSLVVHLQQLGYSSIYVNPLNPETIDALSGTDSASLPTWLAITTSSMVGLVSIPAAKGALTSLLLATSPEIRAKISMGDISTLALLLGNFGTDIAGMQLR